MRNYAYLLIYLFLVTCSTKRYDHNKVNSVVFGIYSGMGFNSSQITSPNYSIVFRYDNGNLYVDKNDSYFKHGASEDESKYEWNQVFNFDSTTLNQLIDNVPLDYSGQIKTFGYPDSHDQGGSFIILVSENKKSKLDLDSDTKEIPKNLHQLSAMIYDLVKDLSIKNNITKIN